MRLVHSFAPVTIVLETEQDLLDMTAILAAAIRHETQCGLTWRERAPTELSEKASLLLQDLKR